MTNYEDVYLLKFFAQNNFYIGICLPFKCIDIMNTIFFNKEFLDFLYDRLSVSNFTFSVNKKIREDYESELEYSSLIKNIFFALLIIKIIVSLIKSLLMSKDYNRFLLDRSLSTVDPNDRVIEEEKENDDKEKLSEKSSLPDKSKNKENELRDIYFNYIYGISAKEENNLYNPFNDKQDSYPFYIKFIKILDIRDNLQLLYYISNKYYNSCGIKILSIIGGENE